jgi:DNA-binding IclR family transcriptional regulator
MSNTEPRQALGTTTTEPPPVYPIASVDHALHLLLLLKNRPGIRVSEAAEELGVAQSTAHRLLAMLVYRGFARQNESSHIYVPGPELFDAGISVLTQLDIRQKAHPFLLRLASVTGETASLQIIEGLEARFVDSVEPSTTVRVGSRVGVSLPVYASSGGKVLMAALPAEALDRLLDGIDLEAITPWATTSRSALDAELSAVREQGYAVNYRGTREDLVAVAVPVRDRSARVIAALSIAGPLSRMDDDAYRAHLPSLLDAVAELEDQLYR